jgi:drug/metabolite transporter (DMT)-like permease
VLLRRALLAFAVLASAAVATVAGFAVYLFTEGYSGGNNPQSAAPLAFPLSFLVLIVVGLPAALACAAAWAGYSAVARKSR